MKANGEFPLVEQSAKGLGVRLGHPGAKDVDIPSNEAGQVLPRTGGMSVVPAWRHLPYFRIPSRLQDRCAKATGSNNLHCWRWGDGDFNDQEVSNDLSLRVDSANHGLIEPSRAMSVIAYAAALASTRSNWIIDEA